MWHTEAGELITLLSHSGINLFGKLGKFGKLSTCGMWRRRYNLFLMAACSCVDIGVYYVSFTCVQDVMTSHIPLSMSTKAAATSAVVTTEDTSLQRHGTTLQAIAGWVFGRHQLLLPLLSQCNV